MSVFDDLTALISGAVKNDDTTLTTYSSDASIFEVRPQVVVSPTTTKELQSLVHYVSNKCLNGERITLSPRAAGTCMSGGSLSEDIVVDMLGFNEIGEVDTKGRTLWVGSGAYYRDVEHTLQQSGLLFPPYTSSKDLCTIGGMVGNNASGEKSLRYGATVDNIRALKMICADGNEYEFGPLTPEEIEQKKSLSTFEGEIYRDILGLVEGNHAALEKARPKVRKNAAGYALWRVWDHERTECNLAKLIVGSQGTLGIITAVQLNLVEDPKYTRMLVITLNDLTQLPTALKTVLLHHPEGMETYDHYTYELAKQYLPEIAAEAKTAEGQHLVLFAQFADATKEQTDHNARICQKALERARFKVHYISDATEADAHWKIRRASYKLLKDHPGNKRAVPFLEDTIVAIDHYGEYLAALEAILSDYDMVYTYAGHIADGSIRLIPLVDMEASDAVEQVFELARRVYDLVFAFAGSMSVDHNDGLIRTPFLERMYGPEIMHLFTRTKEIFDYHSVFNPGKKVGGSMEYSKAHMSRRNNI